MAFTFPSNERLFDEVNTWLSQVYGPLLATGPHPGEDQQMADWARRKEAPQNPDSFFFLMDLAQKGFTDSLYTERMFVQPPDYRSFCEAIHPDYVFPYFITGMASYVVAQDPSFQQFIQEQGFYYRIFFPLKNQRFSTESESSYQWLMQLSSPCLFDSKGNLIRHLNVYRILHPYQPSDKPLPPDIMHHSGYINQDMSAMVRKVAGQLMINRFSSSEQLVLSAMIAGHQTAPDVQKHTQLDEVQVHDLNRSILAQVKQWFPVHPFQQARSFVKHFQQLGYW